LIGWVDDSLRALMEVNLVGTGSEPSLVLTVWIDTAFDGFLVLPSAKIKELGLQREALAEAILADGQRVMLESYLCNVDWFGEVVVAQVIANEGKLPLLGTELLVNRKLFVDYHERIVRID
jgi:clan AA aspartic protease